MKWLIFTITLLNYVVCNEATKKCSGEVCIPSDYDSLHLPFTNETNNITISIADFKILNIRDNDGIIKTSFWFNMFWYEPRIIPPTNMTHSSTTLKESFYKRLWLPDIMIWNLEDIKMRHFLNKEKVVQYGKNNMILFSTNVLLESRCPMEFENHPFDKHTCEIYFRCYSRNMTEVHLRMGDFIFEGTEIKNLHKFSDSVNLLDYTFDVEPVQRGHFLNHSETGLSIKLQRIIYKYVANIYIPSGLLVTISWVIDNFLHCIKNIKCYFHFTFR